MPLLVRQLDQIEKKGGPPLAVAFPDEGAWKRFHTDLHRWPAITCVKTRDGDKRIITIRDGEGCGLPCHVISYYRETSWLSCDNS